MRLERKVRLYQAGSCGPSCGGLSHPKSGEVGKSWVSAFFLQRDLSGYRVENGLEVSQSE